jgi:hypothetical protein
VRFMVGTLNRKILATIGVAGLAMLFAQNQNGTNGGASGVAARSAFGSKGANNAPVYQTKPVLDVRDISGVDCTGATDSSTGLNTFFASLSGLTVEFPPGVPCKIRANNQIVIQGQTGFKITGDGSTPYNNGPEIFGCGTSNTGAVLYINRSSLWKLEGFDIEAQGPSCTSTFTQSLQVDNTGSSGYTATDTLIDRMSFSSSWSGTAIANYIGINHTSSPNGESFRVRDSLIQCQNSSGSYGINLAGPNQDNAELLHNTINDCFQAIRLTGGNARIANNLMGGDGAYSKFGVNGAAIFVSSCASPPLNIVNNEQDTGGPFLNSNNDTTVGFNCGLINITGNVIGISDLSSTAYPINLGAGAGTFILQGNIVNLTGTTSQSVIGSSASTNCAYGPLGYLIDIGNVNQNPSNSGGWSGCVGGQDFQLGHLQELSNNAGIIQTSGSMALKTTVTASDSIGASSPSLIFGGNAGYYKPDLAYLTLMPHAGGSSGVGSSYFTFSHPTTYSTMGLSLPPIFGGISTTVLTTPPTPAVETTGTAGSTSNTYKLVSFDGTGGSTAAGGAATITTSNSTLSGSNCNKLIWYENGLGTYYYKIYRTAAGGTPSKTGVIGTVWPYQNTTGGYVFLDCGLTGDGTTPSSTNTTGNVSVAGNVSASGGFTGNLTGNVTGNVSGSAGSAPASVYEAGVRTTDKIYTNTQALTGGAATHTFANNFTYTSSSTFGCTCTDQTAANACRAVPTSASTVALAGTGSDVLWIECAGH